MIDWEKGLPTYLVVLVKRNRIKSKENRASDDMCVYDSRDLLGHYRDYDITINNAGAGTPGLRDSGLSHFSSVLILILNPHGL